MKNMKRSFVVMTVLIITLLSASVIYAQGPGGDGGRGGRGPNDGPRDGRPVVAASLINQTSEAADTLPRDVVQARADGQSINDYITEHGANPTDVLNAVLGEIQERLDRAVENGRLTQEEADEQLATATQELADAMASTDPIELPRNDNGRNRGGILDGDVMTIISDALGMEPTEIVEALRGTDMSMADLLTENGADVDAVTADILAALTERTNQAVTDEKITQEQADEILANLEEHVSNALNNTFDRPMNDGNGQERFNFGIIDLVSEALDMTPQAIAEALRGTDQTLLDLLTENGVDVDALKVEIVAAVTDKVNQAVADEVITQERADEFLSNLDEHIDNVLNGNGRDGRPGRGPRQGFGGDNADDQGVLES